MLCILILLGCALLVGAFLAILLLKVLIDVAEFVLTALLATILFDLPQSRVGHRVCLCADRICDPDREMGRGMTGRAFLQSFTARTGKGQEMSRQ